MDGPTRAQRPKEGEDSNIMSNARKARLTSRPKENGPFKEVQGGLVLPLGVGTRDERDGLMYIPKSYNLEQPSPLAVMLHGAGSEAQQGLLLLTALADERRLLLLAPDSRGSTWDMIRSGYGPDVAFIDRALAKTFQEYHVDPAHIAIGGFSDGASYALSLGVSNGHLFRKILAFSPGFVRPARFEDSPDIYVSHGVKDAVLNIDFCSRRLVPRLREAGFTVVYREFDGGHYVPKATAKEAVDWFLEK